MRCIWIAFIALLVGGEERFLLAQERKQISLDTSQVNWYPDTVDIRHIRPIERFAEELLEPLNGEHPFSGRTSETYVVEEPRYLTGPGIWWQESFPVDFLLGQWGIADDPYGVSGFLHPFWRKWEDMVPLYWDSVAPALPVSHFLLHLGSRRDEALGISFWLPFPGEWVGTFQGSLQNARGWHPQEQQSARWMRAGLHTGEIFSGYRLSTGFQLGELSRRLTAGTSRWIPGQVESAQPLSCPCTQWNWKGKGIWMEHRWTPPASSNWKFYLRGMYLQEQWIIQDSLLEQIPGFQQWYPPTIQDTIWWASTQVEGAFRWTPPARDIQAQGGITAWIKENLQSISTAFWLGVWGRYLSAWTSVSPQSQMWTVWLQLRLLYDTEMGNTGKIAGSVWMIQRVPFWLARVQTLVPDAVSLRFPGYTPQTVGIQIQGSSLFRGLRKIQIDAYQGGNGMIQWLRGYSLIHLPSGTARVRLELEGNGVLVRKGEKLWWDEASWIRTGIRIRLAGSPDSETMVIQTGMISVYPSGYAWFWWWGTEPLFVAWIPPAGNPIAGVWRSMSWWKGTWNIRERVQVIVEGWGLERWFLDVQPVWWTQNRWVSPGMRIQIRAWMFD